MNKDIKIVDLINYPFQEVRVDGAYDFEYILESLNIDTYDVDNSKFNVEFFKVKRVYDNPHDSDESSYRYLLFFKGDFTAIYGYTGDRGSKYVKFISKEQKNVLRDYFFSILSESDDYSDILDNDTIDLSDSYTTLFEKDGEMYYHIDDPYNSYAFLNKVENLYYINDDESFSPVKFIETRLKNRHDYSNRFKAEMKYMTIEKDGKKFETPFDRVVFKVKTS